MHGVIGVTLISSFYITVRFTSAGALENIYFPQKWWLKTTNPVSYLDILLLTKQLGFL